MLAAENPRYPTIRSASTLVPALAFQTAVLTACQGTGEGVNAGMSGKLLAPRTHALGKSMFTLLEPELLGLALSETHAEAP